MNFLNDNAQRAYPFVANGVYEMTYSGGGSIQLPKSAIVDATLVIYDTSYSYAEHRTYLYQIQRSGSTLTFIFKFSSEQLSDVELSFCRNIDDLEYATSYRDVAVGEQLSLSIDSPCPHVQIEGWLTTGLLSDLLDVLADGTTATRSDMEIYLEPARVQNLANAFARTISLANADRTRIPESNCIEAGDIDDPYYLDLNDEGELSSIQVPSNDYFINAACLQGPIRFKAGFNCEIIQNSDSNTLIVSGVVGGGEGEPCSEVPLYEDEVPPTDSDLLSGGPSCSEIVKTIQGLGGPRVFFLPGTGVSIEPSETNPHKLVVRIDAHGLARCSED